VIPAGAGRQDPPACHDRTEPPALPDAPTAAEAGFGNIDARDDRILDRRERVLAGWQVQRGSPRGVLSWARMTSTAPRSTIDIAEPGREVERAAEIFARGERDTFPPQAFASLKMAVELTMIVVPQCSRHRAELAAVDEFLIRIGLKLGDADDARDVIRRAREQLAEMFPTKN
jgi:hypothetical protein